MNCYTCKHAKKIIVLSNQKDKAICLLTNKEVEVHECKDYNKENTK